MLPRHNEATPKVSKGKEQVIAGPKDDRRKCFKCTVKGKVCSLIVDGGSCANAVSAYMVEKLELGGTGAYLLLMVESDELNQHDEIPARVKPLLSEFADVFPTELPTGLPPNRGFEHQIDLVPGSVVPNKSAYRCSPHEAKELEKQVNELVAKGYVRTSMSPWSVPALLVPKKDSSMRMCVDSRAINNITIKYRYPIPILDDMLDELHGSCVFSKVVLRSGYHQIRMKEGDEWKTAFTIKGGLFEWLVMPFGLSNAPSTFMRLMNEVLRPLIVFLGYVVSEEDISMDPSKVEAIRSWPTLKYINGQHKLNPRHAKWVEFLQMYSFVSKHKAGTSNVVADALSRRYSLLSILEARVLGFSFVKELYEADPDFAPILNCSPAESKRDYVEQDGFLFKGSRLCIPKNSIRELLIREAHGGGLAGHFGINKTLDILRKSPFEIFYGANPLTPIDLIPFAIEPKVSVDAVAKAKEMKKMYEQLRAKIVKTNQQYKAKANQYRKQPTFVPGDLVWIHLRKERFPAKRKNKLMPRAEGPFKVLEKVGDNAYKVELPRDTAVESTFNVGDLMPYLEDDNLENLSQHRDADKLTRRLAENMSLPAAITNLMPLGTLEKVEEARDILINLKIYVYDEVCNREESSAQDVLNIQFS
ncbi:uncharacterized protein [Rutidosis leptorrhynchoides]|uniref:uncharacterized protein n=1 Tax=Rutidosis leptorrhynchoides TaxID=125765 RepID=UPI003A99F65D